MEIQLQELIEKIKKDGVTAAQADADAVKKAASREAAQIIEDAKSEAARIIEQAREEADRFRKAGDDAIRQSARNQLISFRESVTKELQAVTLNEVDKTLTQERLSDLIEKTVEEWTKNTSADTLTVLLNSEELLKLEDCLKQRLNQKLKEGLTLKADEHLSGGFRISVNESGAYYDYSKEAVADLLSAYLSPRLSQLMKEASK